jgi:hypothetical protein
LTVASPIPRIEQPRELVVEVVGAPLRSAVESTSTRVMAKSAFERDRGARAAISRQSGEDGQGFIVGRDLGALRRLVEELAQIYGPLDVSTQLVEPGKLLVVQPNRDPVLSGAHQPLKLDFVGARG